MDFCCSANRFPVKFFLLERFPQHPLLYRVYEYGLETEAGQDDSVERD